MDNGVAGSHSLVVGCNGPKERRGRNCEGILEMNVKCLTFFGIMLPKKKEGRWMNLSLLRPAFFIGFSYLSQLSSEIVNVYMSLHQPEVITSASFLFLTHLIQASKFYHVYRYQSRLCNLIKAAERKEFRPQTPIQEKILQRYATMSRIITIVFLSTCLICCVLLALYACTAQEVTLPVPGWFPWELNTTFNYAATFTYQSTVATINGLTNICMDTLISGLIMIICSQLHILNDSLKNLRQIAAANMGYGNNEEAVSPELQKCMDRKLGQCIIHRSYIFEFADEVLFLFSSSIFGQFLVSVIIICVTLFEMALIPFTSIQFFSLLLYLCCMLMEIFLWCYFGNEITLQNSQLANFAFECDWRNCSKDFRRNLLCFMTSSQKVFILYAGGFLALSLDTFVTIVKSAWSYFAVLYQVNTKQQHK